MHLQIFEEAQLINDRKMKIEAFPMGAATNATRIFIGTAGFRLCYMYRGIEEGRSVYRYDFEEVIKQKRGLYELTGDPAHLGYEKFMAIQRLARSVKWSDWATTLTSSRPSTD